MRNGGDSRGNSYARRRRAQELLEKYGDGEVCNCVWCGRKLTSTAKLADHPECEGLEQDRIKSGGPYVTWNLQPACRKCNASRGNADLPKSAVAA